MAEKSLTSAHELVYAIAYSLVGISVIETKRLFDEGEEAPRGIAQ